MPEGPEVTYVSEYICNKFHGRTLQSLNILSGRYVKHGPPSECEEFRARLPLKLEAVRKKGKVIFMHFEQGWVLISRLGMTGWWFEEQDAPAWHKGHPKNIVLEFDGAKSLVFVDVRNFGTLTVTRDAQIVQKELDKLAHDILDDKVSFQAIQGRILRASTKRKEWLMEDVLMDQQFILSGIGNYLKSEVLYESQISPLRKLKDVTPEEWKHLFQVAQKKAQRMLEVLRSDVLTDLPENYFEEMKVYQRKVDPHGNPIVKHKTKAGRSTFWVPQHQK